MKQVEMEVITIESRAFRAILDHLEEIKAEMRNAGKESRAMDKWMDNEETAKLLKVSKRTLQNYRDAGEISFSQTGSKIYYRASDIEEFLHRYYHKAFKK